MPTSPTTFRSADSVNPLRQTPSYALSSIPIWIAQPRSTKGSPSACRAPHCHWQRKVIYPLHYWPLLLVCPTGLKTMKSIADTVFNHRICLFRTPLQISMIQKEDIWHETLQRLKTRVPRTQVKMFPTHDIANLLMPQMVTTLVAETTMNWDPYLFPLMFNYNTSFKPEGQDLPFFLTFETESIRPKVTRMGPPLTAIHTISR